MRHVRRYPANTMKRLSLWIIPLVLVVSLVALPALAAMQSTGVTAEAIAQANLRARPDVESELLGQITAGTRYAVLGRSEFFPWYLLGDLGSGQPVGWVFAELVTVQGNAGAVPISTAEVTGAPLTPAPIAGENTPPDAQASPTPNAPTPTPTLTAAVSGTVLGEINIRYGPGVNFPRLGVAQAGAQFEITRYHTQMPWVEIRYPNSPDGIAWVALDLLTIQGDLYSLPSTSRTDFNLPTLTPTHSAVQAVALYDEAAPVSPAFQALGNQIWKLMQDSGFELGTSRPGAFFLMDLQTGEAVTFGENIAFSGMSLNKIAILARLYGELDQPPDNSLAVTITEAMICSENISTNKMLSTIGGGSPFRGAREVTTFLQQLGLNNTFMTAPFANDPFITPEAAGAPTTGADQRSAEPDLFNQMTVDDMGILLADMYQCAYQERGPLLEEQFSGKYTPRECRQMLHAMSGNKINALFESGVPLDTRIAHKHGWINDTHGNAGIIFTPGGDYVLVAVVHNPVWLDFSESFPLLAEISREVYNFYNPDEPVAEIRDADGADECHLLGNPLIQDLMSSTYDG